MFRLIAFLFAYLVSSVFDAEGGGGSGDGGGSGGGEGGGEGGGQHSDADVDKYKGAARSEERNAWLAALGVKDRGEAERMASEYRAAQEEAQSDFEKLEGERDTLKAERDEALRLADERLIGAELRTAFVGVGVLPGKNGEPSPLKDALALADRSGLELADDGTVTGLDEVVQATIKDRPWLTGQQQQQQRRAADVTRQSDISSDDVAPGLERLRVAYGP